MNNKLFYDEVITDVEGNRYKLTVTDKILDCPDGSVALSKINNIKYKKMNVPFPFGTIKWILLGIVGLMFFSGLWGWLTFIFFLVVAFNAYRIYLWNQNRYFGYLVFMTSAGKKYEFTADATDIRKLSRLHMYMLESIADF